MQQFESAVAISFSPSQKVGTKIILAMKKALFSADLWACLTRRKKDSWKNSCSGIGFHLDKKPTVAPSGCLQGNGQIHLECPFLDPSRGSLLVSEREEREIRTASNKPFQKA